MPNMGLRGGDLEKTKMETVKMVSKKDMVEMVQLVEMEEMMEIQGTVAVVTMAVRITGRW